jgi:hygromycin-B 4-O-kinase
MTYTKESVQDFLQKSNYQEIINLTPASGGDWSQAFFFEADGQSKVIRFSLANEDFLKDKFAYRFNAPNLPIPKIEEIGKAFDGYYAISPKIEGEMIDHLPNDRMKLLVPQVLSLFNALRTVDVSETTGYGGWNVNGKGTRNSWREFLVEVNKYDPVSRVDWRSGLASRPETSALFNRVYQEMTRLLEYCPEERHLIHNDLLHFNLITRENKVAGVIDWGCSLYGDFLYDLAMFDLWSFYYPSMEGINWRVEAKKYFEKLEVNTHSFEERLKCYQCHLALDTINYNVFKNNEKNLAVITDRIQKIIN